MGSNTYYEPGRYLGHVTETVLGKTKNDNPQLVIRFRVNGGIDPADPDGSLINTGEIYERTIYRVITTKTIDWTRRDLEALGFQGSSFAEITPNCFAGKEIIVECKHEEWEGTIGEKWQIAHGGGALEVKPLEAKEIRELDAMFGKSLKKTADAAAHKDRVHYRIVADHSQAPAAVAADTVGSSANNDDLPF